MRACAISLNLDHRLVPCCFLTREGRSSLISRLSLMAKLVDVGSIGCYFESLSDPRHPRNRKHLLVDIAVIAIDGKTCRRSHDHAKDLGPLHIVSAWASEEGIALGQVATDAKSNEITAIPQLLAQLELTNTIVTIDAMGCQKEIVAQIVDG